LGSTIRYRSQHGTQYLVYNKGILRGKRFCHKNHPNLPHPKVIPTTIVVVVTAAVPCRRACPSEPLAMWRLDRCGFGTVEGRSFPDGWGNPINRFGGY